MEQSPVIAAGRGGLLFHDTGRVTLLDAMTKDLVSEIKGHGHYGNVMHHVAGGNWGAVDRALQDLLVLPQDHHVLSPLARNLVTMLHDSVAANLRTLRPWLLDRIEHQTTHLYRRTLERRLDILADQIRDADVAFRRSAGRILHEAK